MLLLLKCTYNYVLKYCCFLNRNEGGLELNILFSVFKFSNIFFVSLKDAQVKILLYITFRLQMCLMMTVMIPLKVICGLI